MLENPSSYLIPVGLLLGTVSLYAYELKVRHDESAYRNMFIPKAAITNRCPLNSTYRLV